MSDPIRTLIVDDDALSRKRIRALLEEDPEIEVAGEAENGEEGIALIRAVRPDLVFLDVQMPGVDGFGVVHEIGVAEMPVVVFASAYMEFALRAFEACALDYLLKPFDQERFQVALQRAKREARSRRPEADDRMRALMEFLRRPQQTGYPEVLAVKTGEQYAMVRVAEIDWVEADGNYARLHLQKGQRLITKTLTELEKNVLDPGQFARIHRSTIVNLSRIAQLEPLFHGEYSVVLQDGTRLVCSRRYRHVLKDRIYFTS